MSNVEQTLAEIRRRDNMYPNVELTAGAVADRRTLLNIIDQLQEQIRELQDEVNDMVVRHDVP